MNARRIIASAIVGIVVTTGCVSIDSTRTQLNSKDISEVKKAEETIYTIATTGRDSSGFVQFQTLQQIEYVQLSSNQELLLRIIDNAHSSEIIEAATERLDFSQKGSALSFVQERFRQLEIVDDPRKKLLKERIIEKLTQEELLDLIGIQKTSNGQFEMRMSESARDGRGTLGHELDYRDKGMLINRLIAMTDSPDVLWSILSEKDYVDDKYKEAAEKKLLTMLDKVTDITMAEKLITMESRHSNNYLVTEPAQRLMLMKVLPQDKMINLTLSSIESHNVYKWNEGEVDSLVLGVDVMSYIKDTKVVVKIASAILAKIAEYRKACKDSWTMDWTSSDENKVKTIMGRLPKLSDDTLAELICLDAISWKYFMGAVTGDVAYKVLTLGKAKSDKLEEELVKKLPTDKLDMNVYNGVKTDAGKKAVLAAMPAELRKTAQESSEKSFASVLEKAKAAAKETFELHGFYLGMDWADMKQVLSHHFPDYTITENRDGDKKDSDFVVFIPKQKTPFCYASAKDKKVYQFNFGKAMLKKWYKYDVQTDMEWVHAYERETRIDMKFKMIEKETTVYEMDMSRSYRVWFHQESYQYKHNTKEYRLTYFGEEKDFTFEGGIGGAIIKEMAAPRFRYVRGDPGSLRATVEND